MADPTSEPQPVRSPRWIKIVLGLSLAVNLAIAGAVAGFVLRGAPVRDNRGDMGFAAPYMSALTIEARRDILRAMRANDALPKRSTRRAHYAEMIAALRAEPFDVAKVQEILTRQAQSVGQVQDVAISAWLATVGAMSVAERAIYVAQIEEVLRRGPRRKDGDRQER